MIQELLMQLNDAKESMELAEADGNSNFAYHEGRVAAYTFALALARKEETN